ncbi:MAG: hypothetical protein QUV07_14385 [Cyanobium sp. CZS 25K]|nr:hypothetical protein [Cyanobium sp. CZS25K]
MNPSTISVSGIGSRRALLPFFSRLSVVGRIATTQSPPPCCRQHGPHHGQLPLRRAGSAHLQQGIAPPGHLGRGELLQPVVAGVLGQLLQPGRGIQLGLLRRAPQLHPPLQGHLERGAPRSPVGSIPHRGRREGGQGVGQPAGLDLGHLVGQMHRCRHQPQGHRLHFRRGHRQPQGLELLAGLPDPALDPLPALGHDPLKVGQRPQGAHAAVEHFPVLVPEAGVLDGLDPLRHALHHHHHIAVPGLDGGRPPLLTQGKGQSDLQLIQRQQHRPNLFRIEASLPGLGRGQRRPPARHPQLLLGGQPGEGLSVGQGGLSLAVDQVTGPRRNSRLPGAPPSRAVKVERSMIGRSSAGTRRL